MSVLLETTLGDIVIDLYVNERERTCKNFLKLCKTKFYNFCTFFYVKRNFIAQTGDPTGRGTGGESIFASLYGTQDIRICHTMILEDPFEDPDGLRIPSRSPSPNRDVLESERMCLDEELADEKALTTEELDEEFREKEARAQATVLEMIGDLPSVDVKPPENVLFVCKLNPATCSEDLHIIFSRFGEILSCEVIRDCKTGNSLQYAFIEFDQKEDCEKAYFKMDNVLIDDRRIHVDFSQSVSKMRWQAFLKQRKNFKNGSHSQQPGGKKLASALSDDDEDTQNDKKIPAKIVKPFTKASDPKAYRHKNRDDQKTGSRHELPVSSKFRENGHKSDHHSRKEKNDERNFSRASGHKREREKRDRESENMKKYRKRSSSSERSINQRSYCHSDKKRSRSRDRKRKDKSNKKK